MIKKKLFKKMNIICKDKVSAAIDTSTGTQSSEEEIIVCANCNYKITDPSCRIIVNDSFSHVFANPHGHVYEIGCFSKAEGCISSSEFSGEFTWFPGFSWQTGVCLSCATHIGWIFSGATEKFYGLILEKLISP